MEKLGIIGCGTMGHSIALAAAWAGMPVKVHGLNGIEIKRAQEGLAGKLRSLQQNDVIREAAITAILSRILFTQSLDEVAGASSFIIETIPEDMALKKELFAYLDNTCSRETILATNTSGLSPTEMASATAFPQRVVVTHFWNPAHLIPLVEVVRGEKTNDQTVERAFGLLRSMNKKPIDIKKEAPGFVGNRLQFALLREAQYILEQGIASKEDIDAAVTYGIGRRLPVTGPLLSADMGGLDVFSAISDYLFSDLSNASAASAGLKKLVADKKFGAKSGEGYYEWPPSFYEERHQAREAALIGFLKQDRSANNAAD